MQHLEFSMDAVDGIRLSGQIWEPETEAKAVVCLVHGLGEHCGRYAHVAASLAQRDFALIAFDLRGHGKSQGQRGHTPAYDAILGDIELLLGEAATRYPDKPHFLWGHSMGANPVLNYVLRWHVPLAGVIATGAWLRLAFDPPAPKLLMGRIMDRLRPSFDLPNGLDVSALSHDPAVARAYRSDPLVHDRVSARLGLSMLEMGEWALEHATEFPLPLLIMHGGADRITAAQGSREFAQKVPGDCTLRVWDGFYHELHNELQKQEVLDVICDWLSAHLPLAEDAGKAGGVTRPLPADETARLGG